MIRSALLPLAALTLVSACASIPAEETALMSGEIDCTGAQRHISSLEAARPGDLRRARVLGSSLTAGGLLIGVATDDMADRERILSGAYGEQIDARISQIRTACEMPRPATG